MKTRTSFRAILVLAVMVAGSAALPAQAAVSPSTLTIDLNNLDAADGACLLHAQGATRAGAVAIGADDAELIAASREVKGHALTLALLGRYLALAFGGDIRQRDQVDFRDADADAGD